MLTRLSCELLYMVTILVFRRNRIRLADPVGVIRLRVNEREAEEGPATRAVRTR